MGGQKSKQTEPIPDAATAGIPAALSAMYKTKILPLERLIDYEFFDGPCLYDAEFSAKPTVLFLGQYSVGKTTVIKYLVGEDIPGIRIGPEPTTDTFTFVMYDTSSRIIPGTSLMAEANFPFKGLAKFGASFLSKCNAATCPSALLQHITFIDTPGILSGEKQRVSRGYDFEQVVSFLAEKVDRILLLFDAHKLDISDEFKRTILSLQGNEEKVKIILNKVDSVEPGSLNRVNGALMWSLGKVLRCPEVPQLFTGSLWDRPIRNPQYRTLFEADTKALFDDLRGLPRTVNVRRINDVMKRARSRKKSLNTSLTIVTSAHSTSIRRMIAVHEAKWHTLYFALYLMICYCKKDQVRIFAFLMGEITNSLGCCPDEKTKAKIAEKLDTTIYAKVSLHHRIPMSDLPNAVDLKKRLMESDFKKWQRLDKKVKELLSVLDDFINRDVTQLISALPPDSQIKLAQQGILNIDSRLFSAEQDFEMQWSTVLQAAEKHQWQAVFEGLKPGEDGKLHSANAKEHMEKSGLPTVVLQQIWHLVDIDKDNRIGLEEFYLMNYMLERQVAGKKVPKQLPPAIMPPAVGIGSVAQSSKKSSKAS